MNNQSQTFQEAARRIREAAAIAIVLPDRLSEEVMGCAVAIARGLEKLEKTVSVFAPPIVGRGYQLPGEVTAEGYQPLREFIISFDLTRSPIKELKYEREANRLNVILSPTGGRIRREDVEFRYGALRYDLVITLGLPRLEDATQALAAVPDLPYERTVLNIDAAAQNSRYGELNLLPDSLGQGAVTLAAMVHHLLETLNVPPNDTGSATALLAALAAATENFGNELANADAFALAAKLLSAGAERRAVKSFLSYNMGLEQLVGRALARSRLEGASTLWLVLNADDFRKTGAETEVKSLIKKVASHLFAERYLLLWQHPQDERVRLLAYSHSTDEGASWPLGWLKRDEAFYECETLFDDFAEAEHSAQQLLVTLEAVQ